jgi:hypothetical protein
MPRVAPALLKPYPVLQRMRCEMPRLSARRRELREHETRSPDYASGIKEIAFRGRFMMGMAPRPLALCGESQSMTDSPQVSRMKSNQC